jgi:hypothetical protein
VADLGVVVDAEGLVGRPIQPEALLATGKLGGKEMLNPVTVAARAPRFLQRSAMRRGGRVL